MIPYAAVAAGTLAISVVLYVAGHQAGADKVQARWDQASERASSKLAEMAQLQRATEARTAEQLQRVSDELASEQLATTEDLHRTVADLNTGTLRLRERFQGCERKLSEATQPPPGDDGPTEAGLSAADQEFLIRSAARADKYAHQLIACQAYINNL